MALVTSVFLDFVAGIYYVEGTYHSLDQILEPPEFAGVGHPPGMIAVDADGLRLRFETVVSPPSSILWGGKLKSIVASAISDHMFTEPVLMAMRGSYNDDFFQASQPDVPPFTNAGADYPLILWNTNDFSPGTVYFSAFYNPNTGSDGVDPSLPLLDALNFTHAGPIQMNPAAQVGAGSPLGLSWRVQDGVTSVIGVQGETVDLGSPDMSDFVSGDLQWFVDEPEFSGINQTGWIAQFAIYRNSEPTDVGPTSNPDNPLPGPPPSPTPGIPRVLTPPIPTPLPCVPCCASAAPCG